MRVFIAGIDGYLGWSLAQYLAIRGHDVGGVDGYQRREWVAEMGGQSATPILGMQDRQQAYEDLFDTQLWFREGDLTDWRFVSEVITEFKPDAIVHLGECPSAPYSMIDLNHTVLVQQNNIVGTLNILHAMRDITPDAHLVKLGTMGEYGTPNVDIPEGFFEIEYNGRTDLMPFPRQAGSWYHWSKVHDSNNVMFACNMWGLRSTDIMQGVVFGTRFDDVEDDRMITRVDFDQAFGTIINRFCCQAIINHPLTTYGHGGQKRSFIPLKDSMQCMTLVIENPPDKAEYRVFNQFQGVFTVGELAEKVRSVASNIGIDANIVNLENPRIESEDHYYNPAHQALFDLGYEPTEDIDSEIKIMLQDLLKYSDRIESKKDVLIPDVRWNGSRQKAQRIASA
ncbi:MAG TPA: NAD-dependent dehydratase [Chloroflexi bacterium]|nr:NAD-dependent dehydratase [Chloroflexota bacterium]HCU98744.1 NAD-dependent dehydratase [Chloroflexota bacterium]|tara:strand:+ start:1057 stop:2244 length:1188 start_codon:yes stop_codon:yes gene_type:complete